MKAMAIKPEGNENIIAEEIVNAIKIYAQLRVLGTIDENKKSRQDYTEDAASRLDAIAQQVKGLIKGG